MRSSLCNIPGPINPARMTAAALVAIAGLAGPLRGADPTLNDQGEMGRTSYITLPFVNDVSKVSWGATSGLAPANLHWESGTWFTNASNVQAAKNAADGWRAKGIVPLSGAQRWQSTYMAAQPALPDEPSWVTSDRISGDMLARTDYQAWVAWEQAHSNLFMLNADGTQAGRTVGSWFGNYGHISPLMPLPQADWPTGRTNVTYGEWYAYKWGQTAQKSGANAIMLSDFAEAQPHKLSYETGFNPEIISAFSKSLGNASIPAAWGTTIPQQSAYINANLYSKWTDHLCQGYAKYFGQLATELTNNTGHEGLVLNQGSRYPSILRLYGVDDRIVAQNVSSKNFIHWGWDGITMQVGRGGKPMIWGLGGSVMAAAREPNVRIGANLSADDTEFWQAVDYYWNGDTVNYKDATFANTSPDLQERGLKELKREWLEHAWAHIADRQGNVRRALGSMSRGYWDDGKLDAKVAQVMRDIVPTRPFGFAVYYSTDVERKVEADVPTKGWYSAYYNPDLLGNFKSGGGLVNYYVSDAALDQLKPNAKPAAWILLEKASLLSATERSKLEAVAPILTSLTEAKNFAIAPLKFSTTNLSGDGFYDQNDRLIILATNLTDQYLDAATTSMTLRGLPLGQYLATDLFSNGQFNFSVTDASVTISFDVTRWDTRAFAITSVPEPSLTDLVGLIGAVALVRRRRD
jgi:hypothetical protein